MKKTWFLPAAAALLLVGCAQNEPKDAQEVIGQYEAATGLSGVTKDTPLMLKLRMNMSDSTKMYCTFIVNPPQERLRLEMSVNWSDGHLCRRWPAGLDVAAGRIGRSSPAQGAD